MPHEVAVAEDGERGAGVIGADGIEGEAGFGEGVGVLDLCTCAP